MEGPSASAMLDWLEQLANTLAGILANCISPESSLGQYVVLGPCPGLCVPGKHTWTAYEFTVNVGVDQKQRFLPGGRRVQCLVFCDRGNVVAVEKRPISRPSFVFQSQQSNVMTGFVWFLDERNDSSKDVVRGVAVEALR